MSGKLSHPEEDEIQRLLKIKIDKLRKLDTLDEDESGRPAEKKPSRSRQQVFNKEFSLLPRGKEGLDIISKHEAVLRIEEQCTKPYRDSPKGESLNKFISQMDVKDRTADYKSRIQRQYEEAIPTVENLYKKIAQGKQLHNRKILDIVEDFMRIFIKDRCIILNLVNYHCNPEDYLYDHALHVCLLCLNIATACSYSRKQVLEIGEAGLLADVGMLLLPNETRFDGSRLNKDAFIDIQKHTMIGITLLEKIEQVPPTVTIAAYQHHERVSGTGYNKQRSGRLIHNYAKIVAVADVYHAFCSERAYRKGDLPNTGINKVIKMSQLNLLEKSIVKNFVKYVSLYPIGSFIQLSDHRIARVVQANENEVSRPIVSVLTDESGNLLNKNEIKQINLAWDTSLSITEAVEYVIDSDRIMDGF